jgi:hypothetical protein
VPQRSSRNKTTELNMIVDTNGKVGKITKKLSVQDEDKNILMKFKK